MSESLYAKMRRKECVRRRDICSPAHADSFKRSGTNLPCRTRFLRQNGGATYRSKGTVCARRISPGNPSIDQRHGLIRLSCPYSHTDSCTSTKAPQHPSWVLHASHHAAFAQAAFGGRFVKCCAEAFFSSNLIFPHRQEQCKIQRPVKLVAQCARNMPPGPAHRARAFSMPVSEIRFGHQRGVYTSSFLVRGNKRLPLLTE